MTLVQSELAHSRQFPDEAQIIKHFSSVFSIKDVQRRRHYRTELSLYFAKPTKMMTESFGFEQEVAIFITGSAKMEPRAMQAIHQVMSEGGAVGRVDPSVYFLVSDEQGAREWVENYIYQNPQLSFPVVLTTSALNRLSTNPWAFRNLIGEQLYFRDLFDYQLPIHNDLDFLGVAPLSLI